jgi:hypothetical protein
LINAGTGYALDVKGVIAIDVAGVERWSYGIHLPTIAPAAKHDFVPRLSDAEQMDVQVLADEQRTFRMKLTCKDANDRTHTFDGVADWRTYTDHVFKAGMLVETDHEQEVRRYLERISKAVGYATDASQGVKVTTRTERREEMKEWTEDMRRRREEQNEKASPDPEIAERDQRTYSAETPSD